METETMACNQCGKEGRWENIKTHIESKHIVSDISHPCDICGKVSRSRHGLRLHKAKQHTHGLRLHKAKEHTT